MWWEGASLLLFPNIPNYSFHFLRAVPHLIAGNVGSAFLFSHFLWGEGLGTHVVLGPVISCAVCWSSSGCLFCWAEDECCGIVQLVWSETLKVHLIFRGWAKAQGLAGMQLHEHVPSSLCPCCSIPVALYLLAPNPLSWAGILPVLCFWTCFFSAPSSPFVLPFSGDNCTLHAASPAPSPLAPPQHRHGEGFCSRLEESHCGESCKKCEVLRREQSV